MNRLPRPPYPNTTAILPPRLLGSVAWYAAMASYGKVVVDTAFPYDKRQKAVHRYDIADTRGHLALTVPLTKPEGGSRQARWSQCAVSTHDQWWQRHLVTLESAYGRTPYFEFIIDRFKPLLRSPEMWAEWPDVITLCRLADEAIRSVLLLPATEVVWAPADSLRADEITDLRRTDFSLPRPLPPYFQVRDASLGFIPGLSAIDLIFNLGPEAAPFLIENYVPSLQGLPN